MFSLLIQLDGSDFLASREVGRRLRFTIEDALKRQRGEEIRLDFSAVKSATQSCMDEMIGVLVRQHGEIILSRILFDNCEHEIRTLIQFVISDRLSRIPAARAPALSSAPAVHLP